jgi:lysophospholipid acyltransferase (LPLAT)-like uncharacterized protein
MTVIGEEIVNDLQRSKGESLVLVSWHGRTLIPITRFRNRGYWAMISTSQDGNIQNELFHLAGFNTVRGSTSARGAVEASLVLRRELRKGAILAHTPDGPRGPIAVAHPGAVYFAQKGGCPIVPAGIAASPCYLLKAWDQYMIPLPFAKAAIVYGEPITIPPNLDAKGRDEYAAYIGGRINALQEFAETIVRSRRRYGLADRPASTSPIPGGDS